MERGNKESLPSSVQPRQYAGATPCPLSVKKAESHYCERKAESPVWKPLKHDPRAVARFWGGTFVATRLFMTGRAAPSPSPTQTLAAKTAGTV